RAIAEEIERVHRWDALVYKDRSESWGTILQENETTLTFQPKDSKERESIEKSSVWRIDRKGRPVLVGTTSIEKSELISGMLERRGIGHQVLNAKHHKREAEIVAQAGRRGAVTIATNMAGRGTDIVLGGNPETMAWAVLQDKYPTRLDVPRAEWDALVAEIDTREKMKAEGQEVKLLGGLHVIGTERHEARRIDLQLRGRCGRQGDPGSSRFYLSLRDDLMRIFAGPWAERILKSLGMPEGEAIESRMVSRRIEAAQKKVEERNFEVRKSLLEYDEVMDEQRKRVYTYRQRILEGANCKELILDMVASELRSNIAAMAAPDYGVEMFASWAGTRLHAKLEPKSFRGMGIEEAEQVAQDVALRQAETQIHDAIEENLPADEDHDEWNWQALANFGQRMWDLELRDRDLKKVGRDEVAELLLGKAEEAIRNVNLKEGGVFLEADFAARTISAWVKQKFQIDLPADSMGKPEVERLVVEVLAKAEQAYQERESEYAALAAMYRFSRRSAEGTRVDRNGLREWASHRYGESLEEQDFQTQPLEALRERIVSLARGHQGIAREKIQLLTQRLTELFGETPRRETAMSRGVIDELKQLLVDLQRENLTRAAGGILDLKELKSLPFDRLKERLVGIIDERFHPEMRRMER
ncbi:MAG TPA: preprotein translocase subunit SecA, partial [Pirellulaceae bacterium]